MARRLVCAVNQKDRQIPVCIRPAHCVSGIYFRCASRSFALRFGGHAARETNRNAQQDQSNSQSLSFHSYLREKMQRDLLNRAELSNGLSA